VMESEHGEVMEWEWEGECDGELHGAW
jgi:hypothetical protein